MPPKETLGMRPIRSAGQRWAGVSRSHPCAQEPSSGWPIALRALLAQGAITSPPGSPLPPPHLLLLLVTIYCMLPTSGHLAKPCLISPQPNSLRVLGSLDPQILPGVCWGEGPLPASSSRTWSSQHRTGRKPQASASGRVCEGGRS